ncbi:OPT oligopeptide transporter protein-domain-containing protein [Echria macrotheca]|uniref:OPT oligopeptide transporter protein-domain-containing protein n=1 Tax=Echria macrotheca TaxID=438768 RepID=A0AAJ0F9G4_9PEZI|nr:OPT oligopeptide transporter protein-domain-containing protein [Echria macrotheca]
MASEMEKDLGTRPPSVDAAMNVTVEKVSRRSSAKTEDMPLDRLVEFDLNMTEADLYEARTIADQMSLDEVRLLMENVLKIHERDPNFPQSVIDKIKEFLGTQDIFDNPDKYAELIYEVKLEAALITNNSPYSEVRSVVDNHDDPTLPSSTFRVWFIGLLFSAILAAVNQLFSIRMPQIGVASNVAQLLAYPFGKLLDHVLPDWGFTLYGVRHSLNPGPFTRKEHMLITIMANVASGTPYTNNIIWIQYLKRYFNQPYAGRFAYQILVALSTNLIGYGMAGVTRRFLVYPVYCVWPASLSTIALNTAFHSRENEPVEGPGGRIFRISRYKFFLLAMAAMFVYFWFPDNLFLALSKFSWITWIAPTSVALTAVAGFNNGLGFNPWPTFDWNNLGFNGPDPLMVPWFSTANRFLGSLISAFVILGVWFSNSFYTGYLPINDNHVYDNTASPYNVSLALDEKGWLDPAKYEAYSPAYLCAGNLVVYLFFFAVYPAILMHIILNHRYEVATGFKNLVGGLRRGRTEMPKYTDIHNRLMSKYAEAPEWWYMVLLAVSIACGIAGLACFDTYTTPGVIFFGIALCAVFVVPIGIVAAITGMEVTLNVLAEFIGGSLGQGNSLSMNYFKTYGQVTPDLAISFANDLKLAHYVKIPPRQTFMAQVVATVVSTFICTGILNYQMNEIPHVCTREAPDNMSCPGINTFFTASVLWGTIGPQRVFGTGGQYTILMIGWPLGVLVSLGIWFLQRRLPQQKWLRQIHPVLILLGGLIWAPYNLSYAIPSVWIGWLSWIWCKNRFLGFWSKYNFVLSAAFTTGISLAGTVILFALEMQGVELKWWGNDVVSRGCEGDFCVLKTLGPGEYFGPGPGQFH